MVSAAAELRPHALSPASPWEVNVITNTSGFDRLRESWNVVAGQMRPSSPMLSWEWCRAWWTHFAVGRLCIVTFGRDGQVLGIAPFHERRVGLGPLAVRALKPIGWEDYGNQGMTEQLELLFPSDHRAELMAELEKWLRANRITSAWLPSIELDGGLPSWLAGRVVERQVPVQFHHRALPSDWLVFVQGLNKSMRSNSRYYAKRLIRHGHSFELEVAESPLDVSRALPEAIRLHRTRAQAESISRVKHWDHFYRGDRAVFLQEVGPMLAEKGEFKVGTLRIDGDVVACQMWFEKANTIFLYYSGFVPEWAPYGVQLVTTLEVFKHGMRRGIRHVEFLRGGGQVKERWDTETRLVSNTLCAPNRPLAQALAAAQTARVSLKRLSRS